MTHDYSALLDNLQGRRFDEARRESIMSDSFDTCDYPKSLKYCLEAMEEIEASYAYKAFYVSKKIQDKLLKELVNRGIKADFRYQGPIQTETNILLFGGIELMIIQNNDTQKPWEKVKLIAAEVMDILTLEGEFKSVDYSTKHKIKVTTSKPTCEISILPGIWLDNADFRESKREIDRGIIEYDFSLKTQKKYLPFKHIARINAKDKKTNGGLKRIIRLLNTLVRDAGEIEVDLNHTEIESIVYAIPEKQLIFEPNKSLALLGIASAQMNRVASDLNYLQKLVSPSEKEIVFGTKPGKQEEVQKLKKLLDILIADLKEDLSKMNKNIYSELSY
jgi:hypothetical protein